MDGLGIDVLEYDEVLRDCESLLGAENPEEASRTFAASCLPPLMWMMYSHKGRVSYDDFCDACAEVVGQFAALRLHREQSADCEAAVATIIVVVTAAGGRSCRLLHHFQNATP